MYHDRFHSSSRDASGNSAKREGFLNRRFLIAISSLPLLGVSVWGYDTLGYYRASSFEAALADDPNMVTRNWRSFQTWHPTRHVSLAVSPVAEAERERRLEQRCRQQLVQESLAELRSRASGVDLDGEAVWQQFLDFRDRFPEVESSEELQRMRDTIKSRRDNQIGYRALRAYEELLASETRTTDLASLVVQADAFLRDFPSTAYESEVRVRRDSYIRRIEDRDIEAAREYSARFPLNFATRREHFQRYLDLHPTGSRAGEAATAIATIEQDWDRHDFRIVRDQHLSKPGDVSKLVALCRSYLSVHPSGRFKEAAAELLKWSEAITATHEYRVRLRWGDFEHRLAHYFSRGPDLSVELEVGGIRYGPSNIVANRYDPDWDYTFPRLVRWKLGDSVVVRVFDHDYKKRQVLEYRSEAHDPLAMRLLSGETWQGSNGIAFESDFALPVLPRIE